MASWTARLHWRQDEARYTYWYGETGTRFSAQIGQSTNPGNLVWMIFHDDFRGAVVGGEVGNIDAAKTAATDWLDLHAKPDVR